MGNQVIYNWIKKTLIKGNSNPYNHKDSGKCPCDQHTINLQQTQEHKMMWTCVSRGPIWNKDIKSTFKNKFCFYVPFLSDIFIYGRTTMLFILKARSHRLKEIYWVIQGHTASNSGNTARFLWWLLSLQWFLQTLACSSSQW